MIHYLRTLRNRILMAVTNRRVAPPRLRGKRPNLTDQDLVDMVPVVQDYMHYDILFNIGQCRFGNRDHEAKRHGLPLNSLGTVRLFMYDDDMDFTSYSVEVKGVRALVFTARRGLWYHIPNMIDYPDIVLLPNHRKTQIEDLASIRDLPFGVRRIYHLLCQVIRSTNEWRAHENGRVPAVEALLDLVPDSDDPFFRMDADHERRGR